MKALTSVPAALVCAALALPAAAQAPAPAADTTSSAAAQESTAAKHVSAAADVARKLEAEERMRALLRAAKGVFIVPAYGRAALGVGGAGGAGVLLVHRSDGTWSDPVFYNTGGLSLGLQAGIESGAYVLVLNNDKAVQEFLKKNNFGLNAKAGITVVNWNKMAQASGGTGDVVAWSDTKGLFGDVLTLEFNDIRFNQRLTNAYYRRTLSASDVVASKTSNAQAAPLVQAVSAAAGTTR
ncbi:lipid-binding SYLF domain-containing protein [[Empedobacter] haloabium]|uniref:Lipid-binding SYLF domain-containing protein n=1 Tax=[Empedobacter] haloabium TaxID=592317 RepID=A0ABZ1UFM3_9BURK